MYTERDIENQGQAYIDHITAMTDEGLHSKSDIAAELAHRDIEIAKWKGRYDRAAKMYNKETRT